MAMTDLARQSEVAAPRRATCLSDIADRQEISLPYLEQLFARLRREGLVASVRGPGGGYRLARPLAEISVADVIHAVDEPIRAVRCGANGGPGCLAGGAKCLTHGLWDALDRRIEDFLAAVTLADVVERRLEVGAAAA
jgi:Rrf2 family iron-sulfur cluster assembly transcriptional regulator